MSRCPIVTVSSVVYRCDEAKCYVTFRADVPGSKRDYPAMANAHGDLQAKRAGWSVSTEDGPHRYCYCPSHPASMTAAA